MTRGLIVICCLIGLMGCSKQDEKALELYETAEQYLAEGRYDEGIALLQQIRIDFEDTEYADRAESEITEYASLKELAISNSRSELDTAFTSVGRALENYKARYQAYPLTAQGLERLSASMAPKWLDPWGQTILYKPIYSSEDVPRHMPDDYVLASFGEDGLPGGIEQDQDFFYQGGQMVNRINM